MIIMIRMMMTLKMIMMKMNLMRAIKKAQR